MSKVIDKFDTLDRQLSFERETRKTENEMTNTILIGDTAGVSGGLVGGMSRIETLLTKHISNMGDRHAKQELVNRKQEAINKQVQAHQRIIDFPKRIKWRFVIKWGAIAVLGSSSGLYAILESIGLI